MKKYIQPFLIILFAVSTAYLGFLLYKYKHSSLPIAKQSYSLDSSASVPPVLTYKDSSGATHVVINDQLNSIIDKEATKQATELQPVIDQVASNLGIKSSQVESATTISSQAARDSVSFLKKQLESAQRLTYYYKDKYLTLSVHTNPRDTADIGSFDYKYNADLNIVQYSKKNWFLGAKHYYTDISSNDPNATVMGIKKFTVQQKQPEFGLRISATARYSNNSNSFGIGPSASLDIGAIKGTIRGTYLYNTQTKQWGWGVSIDKDIIRF